MFNRFKWLLFQVVIFIGCQQEDGANNPKKPYHPEKAIENGDVVNLHGEISNLEKFENFLENIKSGSKDEILNHKLHYRRRPNFL